MTDAHSHNIYKYDPVKNCSLDLRCLLFKGFVSAECIRHQYADEFIQKALSIAIVSVCDALLKAYLLYLLQCMDRPPARVDGTRNGIQQRLRIPLAHGGTDAIQQVLCGIIANAQGICNLDD